MHVLPIHGIIDNMISLFLACRHRQSGEFSRLFQVKPGKQPKSFHKIFSMVWKLVLKWVERSETVGNRQTDYLLLLLYAKLVPLPDFKEKLGSVWIIPGNITLHVDDDPARTLAKLAPLKEPLVLRKSNSYRVSLFSNESPIRVPKEELNNWDHITVDVKSV